MYYILSHLLLAAYHLLLTARDSYLRVIVNGSASLYLRVIANMRPIGVGHASVA